LRVSLIQPSQGAHFGLSKILLIEPLGLEYVAAALKLHDHEVQIIDLRLDHPKELWSHLRSFKPAAVGISCSFSSDVYSSLETARVVRTALPKSTVFVGGHHASLIPGDFLFPGSPVDAVVIGEGELTGLEIADTLERGDNPADVAGVLTQCNRNNGFHPRPAGDLDDLPLPDRQLTRRYRRRYHHAFSVPSAAVETSRGCPFDCNFCSVWVFYQRQTRHRSPGRIIEDLEQVRALGGEKVMFTDDIAFLQYDDSWELARRIIDNDLVMHYSCETRTDLVVKHSGLLELWSEAGLRTVFLGVEKFDDAGLVQIRKRVKGGADINLRAIEILKDHGISPMTSLITDPSWDEEDFDRLEEFVKRLNLPNPAFTVLTPLPGTELWETMKSKVTTDDYGFFDVAHLIIPSKLKPQRFYERFAHLYTLADTRTRLTWRAVWNLVRMSLTGHRQAVWRVLSAVREMRIAKKYLRYPGSRHKPDFLPPDYGKAKWIDESKSPLTVRMAPGARHDKISSSSIRS
jgi:radical SAM superfamily enzyme YgiQ (UPF0313 family)